MKLSLRSIQEEDRTRCCHPIIFYSLLGDGFQVQFKVLHITDMNLKLERPSIPKESALTAGAIEKLFSTRKGRPDGDSTLFFQCSTSIWLCPALILLR